MNSDTPLNLLQTKDIDVAKTTIAEDSQPSSAKIAPGRSISNNHHHTDIGKVVKGTAAYSIFSWFYDYVVYSAVLFYGGILWGSITIVGMSILLDLATLKFYDWSAQDWFAIEYLKLTKGDEGNNPFKRCLGAILRSTPVYIHVIALSIKFNSFVVTTLMREHAYGYNGLSLRDWRIFWASNLFGHIYWIFIIEGGIEVGKIIATLL